MGHWYICPPDGQLVVARQAPLLVGEELGTLRTSTKTERSEALRAISPTYLIVDALSQAYTSRGGSTRPNAKAHCVTILSASDPIGYSLRA